MSQNPQSNMPQGYSKPPTNAVGLTGFILSLVSLISCGMGSPVALIVSLIGLRKQPKGLAIAGSIISAVQVIVLVIFGTAIIGAGMKMFGLVKTGVANQTAAHEAAMIIEDHRDADKNLPSDDTGTALIAGKVDYWKTPLQYHKKADTFEITSAGPDMKFGTPDDITFSESMLIPATATTSPTSEPASMP